MEIFDVLDSSDVGDIAGEAAEISEANKIGDSRELAIIRAGTKKVETIEAEIVENQLAMVTTSVEDAQLDEVEEIVEDNQFRRSIVNGARELLRFTAQALEHEIDRL